MEKGKEKREQKTNSGHVTIVSIENIRRLKLHLIEIIAVADEDGHDDDDDDDDDNDGIGASDNCTELLAINTLLCQRHLFLYRYPSYIYPTTAGAAAATYMTAPSVILPHSSLSPTTAGQYVEYASPPYTGQFPNGYEAYPYSTATNGYVTPAAYTYAVPQAIAAGAGHYPHFQAQQIQERL
uniref:Uncharacterized protein n=1 Tax=Octopus bimaculoides TaxID=37653 RepID=A0A0L8I597_OCTBM